MATTEFKDYTELIHAGEGIEIEKGKISATGSGGVSLLYVRIGDFDNSINGYPIVDYNDFISDLDNFKDSDTHMLAVMNYNFEIGGYIPFRYYAEEDLFASVRMESLTLSIKTTANPPYIRILTSAGLDHDDSHLYYISGGDVLNITLSMPD